MPSTARVGAIHALAASIEPTQAAFDRVWKEADVAHLMDGSLYLDRSRGTAGPEEIAARIDRLIRHSAASGAQGILFTGSFFGAAVRQARASVNVPVLTSFDGVIERALGLGQPLVVLSTAPDSTPVSWKAVVGAMTWANPEPSETCACVLVPKLATEPLTVFVAAVGQIEVPCVCISLSEPKKKFTL